MLKRFFTSQSRSITAAAIVLAAASLVSRVLGIVRDRVLAGQFGAGAELDAYYAAFRLPDVLFNIIVVGALSAGLIPILTDVLDRPAVARRLINNVITILASFLCVLIVLLFLFTKPIVMVMTPGFSPDQIALTVMLTRVMLCSPLLLGLSSVVGGVLQVHKNFFIYSLAPIVYNVGIIIGALFFVPTIGIAGVAWGVVLGALLHLIIQLPTYWILGYRWQPVFDPSDKNIRTIITLTIPRTISLAVSQLNLLVITVIASTLATGSIAIFNFANNIQSFPLGLFGVSYALAVFPTLSALTNQKRQFIETLSGTMRTMLFFIVPSSVLLIVLRAQIVRVILGSGQFDWEDTILTLRTLSVFAVSLSTQALILVLVRAFYARRDTVTPLVISLVSVIGNVFIALALAPILGVVGLALAFTTTSMVHFLLLYLALHLRLGRLDGKKTFISGAKILIASFMLALFAQAAKYPFEQLFGTSTFIAMMLQTVAAMSGGATAYVVTCWLLKSEELAVVFQAVQRRLKPPVIPEDIRGATSV